MAKTAIATLRTVWDCRWSRPGFRLAGIDEKRQPETVWVCVRTGKRVSVTEARCENCHHWELTDRPTN